MSECLSPPKSSGVIQGDIQDARDFLRGLRSISLRNLSIRGYPATWSSAAINSGAGGGPSERDLASVTSGSLPNLRARILLNDLALPRDGPAPNSAAEGSPPRSSALLTTGIAQGTVNPTWPVSETAWLHAHGAADTAEDLDHACSLLLRVYAVESPPSGEGREMAGESAAVGQHPSGSGAAPAGDAKESALCVWECVVDIRGLTSMPPCTTLSHLWTLPADCLLMEMSNGGLYTPGWVVEALESNSALPRPSRVGSGIGISDPWRDGSDDDEDENQQPFDEVLRKVLDMEEAAERDRVQLSALLTMGATGQLVAFERGKHSSMLARLKLELAAEESLLRAEEACLEKEERQLKTEAAAVEQLLNDLAALEEAAAADAQELELEKRQTMKSHVLLEARRARLTAELQAIYPIKYQEQSGEYSIRGLELPVDLYSIDDERVSSALGYTAHLVCMLAKYLQVPLRYQLIYNASRSAVRDNVSGAGVAYPLFRRGVEKERFDRGVYLLGRDVEQMLTSRGVPFSRGGGQLLRNLERLMAVESA